MSNWADKYDPDAVGGGGKVIPGVNAVIIDKIEETQTKAGGDMIVIHTHIEKNEKFELASRIVVDSEYFSKNLNAFFDSVKLEHSPKSLYKAEGRRAWGMVQYQKNPSAKDGKYYLELSYFVTEDQKDRPAERPTPPDGSAIQSRPGNGQGNTVDDGFSDSVPF